MKYMGSKRRILKHILPIMLDDMYTNKLTTWVEPFVGGANVIQHVPSKFTRIGSDYFEHTIAALIGVRDHLDSLPDDVSEEYYTSVKGTPADPITSWIRFVCSFAGTFSNGYAREKDSTGRTFAGEGLRNAMAQSPLIQGVDLLVGDYTMHSDKVGCVIYCDPPYRSTTGYKGTVKFDYDAFYDWCRKMSKNNIVYVSEYDMPDDFECVWTGNIVTNFSSQRKGNIVSVAKEKLYRISDLNAEYTFPF